MFYNLDVLFRIIIKAVVTKILGSKGRRCRSVGLGYAKPNITNNPAAQATTQRC